MRERERVGKRKREEGGVERERETKGSENRECCLHVAMFLDPTHYTMNREL